MDTFLVLVVEYIDKHRCWFHCAAIVVVSIVINAGLFSLSFVCVLDSLSFRNLAFFLLVKHHEVELFWPEGSPDCANLVAKQVAVLRTFLLKQDCILSQRQIE
jgi:hypothetical protein